MSCLDKIYTKSYQDYLNLLGWAKDRVFTTPRGVKVIPQEFIIPSKLEYFQNGKEIPIMYSPSYLDRYLYKNCPLQFVQDNLKRMYNNVKELGETHIKPEYEPCTKVKIIKKGWSNNARDRWFVDVFFEHTEYRDYFRYNRDYDYWLLPGEDDVYTSIGLILNISVKATIRKIIKEWKLPKGCKIVLNGRYVGNDWVLETK